MKKVLLIIIVFLLVGCSFYKTNTLICDISTTTITLTFKDGQIINYNDKIRGEASQNEINTMNDHHLLNITDNKEAIEIMKKYIVETGGTCKTQ